MLRRFRISVCKGCSNDEVHKRGKTGFKPLSVEHSWKRKYTKANQVPSKGIVYSPVSEEPPHSNQKNVNQELYLPHQAIYKLQLTAETPRRPHVHLGTGHLPFRHTPRGSATPLIRRDLTLAGMSP